MKRLILQVNVKLNDFTGIKRFKPIPELYELSEQQAKSSATKWDADYYQITDCSFLPDRPPWFQRFKMYDMTEYDQILYLDMDAVVLPTCPNVFDKFAEHNFSAVRDYPWDKTSGKTDYQEKRAVYNSVYEAKEDYRPFCSGVMLVRRDFLEVTKNLWRQHLYSFDKVSNGIQGGHDQAVFNKIVVEALDGKYNELDERWGAWYRQGSYIEHVGGPYKFAFRMDNFKEKHWPYKHPLAKWGIQ